MDLQVAGDLPAAPFLSARDVFETEFALERPVSVRPHPEADGRTRVTHGDGGHRLEISRRAAGSAMARSIALHEFAHMRRHEEGHVSHTLPTEEALFLAFSGRELERRVLAHCYQIANHARDVYADDLTLRVGPADHLVAFLESELAAAVADRPAAMPGHRVTPAADPAITAVNAAFAVALLERHDVVAGDHPIYDLAHAAAADAPEIALGEFRERFRDLATDPDESDYRRALVDLLGSYADSQSAGEDAGGAGGRRAAD